MSRDEEPIDAVMRRASEVNEEKFQQRNPEEDDGEVADRAYPRFIPHDETAA